MVQYGAIDPGGLLNTVLNATGVTKTNSAPQPAPVTADTGIFGLPSTLVYVGAGILVLGGGAYFLSRHKSSSMSGYRRKSRRR